MTRQSSSSIKFPSRVEQDTSRLRDCFRIMAWKEYKRDYQGDLSGLDLYQLFKADWDKHEIQGWDYQKLVEFTNELGYTPGELLKARNAYYEARNGYTQQPVQQSVQQPQQPQSFDAAGEENPPF